MAWSIASIKEAKHFITQKGRVSCYKALIKANMKKPNLQTKQRGERQAASKPNITKMYSPTWLHPNKPPKGTDTTKQTKWPQRSTSTNPQKENKQEHGKGLDLRKQAWIKHKHMKKSKQSINIHRGTNPNSLLKLRCVDVGLDHLI